MESSSTIINSVIGEGTFYHGNIDAVDVLRIDGKFTGTVQSRDVILVGITGKVKGTLSSSRIIIAGMFDGIIRDTDLVILQPTSLVLGKIEAKSVIIELNALMSSVLKVEHLQYIKDAQAINEEPDSVKTTNLSPPLIRMVEKFSPKTLSKMFSV